MIGALRDRGLADSRVVRAGARGTGNGQFTAYWLTAAGAAAARELEKAASRSPTPPGGRFDDDWPQLELFA